MIGVETWVARSHSLLPDLRQAGLPTGLGEQLKVLRLLQLLEEHGAAPDTPETLARWIAPVLCSRSDQLKPLREVIEAHFQEAPRRGPIAAIQRQFDVSRAAAVRRKRRHTLLWPL